MPTDPILPTSSTPTPRNSRLGARRISSVRPDDRSHHLPLPNLSDKAKGKRRAVDEDDHQSDDLEGDGSAGSGSKKSTQEGRGRSITFRFTGEAVDTGDLDVWVDAGESVGRVKDKIKSLRPALHLHPLKIIHSGRLLTDGILLLPYVRTLETRHRQARAGLGLRLGEVVAEAQALLDPHGQDQGQGQGQSGDEGLGEEEKVWLHCVVGAKVEVSGSEDGSEEWVDAEEEAEGGSNTVQPRRRGFDALLDAGLSAAEVANMRRQFYAGRGEEVPEGLDQDDEHTRALEEQWIEGDLTHETAQTAAEGIYTSILTGLLVGFLYPILPWFFFREIPAPNFFDPLEVEPDRQPGARSDNPTSARGAEEGQPEELDWSMGIIPGAGGRSTGGGTTGTSTTAGTSGAARGASEVAPGNPGSRGLFGLRGRAGGEWTTGVVFGQRVQMAILIGTVLNVGFGAFRFLV